MTSHLNEQLVYPPLSDKNKKQNDENKSKKLEALLWSIAFPGFGQFLNGKFLKGILFVILEFVLNVNGNLNTVIVLSFLGETELAIRQANYQWLLFYPCVYTFAMWDAYRDAGGGTKPYSFLLFVLSAYLGTIGLAYSSIFRVGPILLGPVWLGILGLITGAMVGGIVQKLFR